MENEVLDEYNNYSSQIYASGYYSKFCNNSYNFTTFEDSCYKVLDYN